MEKTDKNFPDPSTFPKISWRQPTRMELREEFGEADIQNLMISHSGYPTGDESETAWKNFISHLEPVTMKPSELNQANAWRFSVKSVKEIVDRAKRYGKDPESIVQAMAAGTPIPMPVVIRKMDGSYMLAGGATRTALAALAGQDVTALAVDQKTVYAGHAAKYLSSLAKWADENDGWEKVEEAVGHDGDRSGIDPETYFDVVLPMEIAEKFLGRPVSVQDIEA